MLHTLGQGLSLNFRTKPRIKRKFIMFCDFEVDLFAILAGKGKIAPADLSSFHPPFKKEPLYGQLSLMKYTECYRAIIEQI
jgi:hypothetical protein